MKDFSTILLIKTFAATVEHLETAPEIDKDHSGIKELKRTLEDQITKLHRTL